MSRFVRCTVAAVSITLTLLGCRDAAAPLSTDKPVPVAFVTVEPPTASVLAGQTVQLTATTRDADQKVLTERVVTWASGNTAVATVSSAGLVTGVAVGQATITATSEAKSAAAAIEVVLPGPIPDINGLWDWTEHIADEANRGVCDDTGSYTFMQQGATFVGLSEQAGTCVGPSGPYPNYATDSVRGGVVSGGSVAFRVGSANVICHYTAAFASSSTDSLSGTVTCGTPAGTWRAVRGGDLGSVTVTPASARVLAGGGLQLGVERLRPARQRIHELQLHPRGRLRRSDPCGAQRRLLPHVRSRHRWRRLLLGRERRRPTGQRVDGSQCSARAGLRRARLCDGEYRQPSHVRPHHHRRRLLLGVEWLRPAGRRLDHGQRDAGVGRRRFRFRRPQRRHVPHLRPHDRRSRLLLGT